MSPESTNWENVDVMLYLRTPEEEASGEWTEPTAAEIALHRAQYSAWKAWQDTLPATSRMEGRAFTAGFAAGVAHAETIQREKLQPGLSRLRSLNFIDLDVGEDDDPITPETKEERRERHLRDAVGESNGNVADAFRDFGWHGIKL